MPAPIANWAGSGSLSSGGGGCACAPGDSNGDVGPNHYVQVINMSFQVWNNLRVTSRILCWRWNHCWTSRTLFSSKQGSTWNGDGRFSASAKASFAANRNRWHKSGCSVASRIGRSNLVLSCCNSASAGIRCCAGCKRDWIDGSKAVRFHEGETVIRIIEFSFIYLNRHRVC